MTPTTEQRHGKKGSAIFLCAAALATLASAAYWSLAALQVYYNFKTSFDLAQIESSMYYAIHYASIEPGLQYLVFATHLSFLSFISAVYMNP